MSDDKPNKPGQKTMIGHMAPSRPRGDTPATIVGGRGGTANPAGTAQGFASGADAGASMPPADEDYCGYRLLEKIAEGGMGVVYLGEHTTLGRRGAIKLLKSEFCQNEEIVHRFHQEARAVNVIGHENIVEIFDFGRTRDGRVFFVMEYLEGEPLSNRLARGPMGWSEARPLLEQMLRALAAAHACGLVHRDLKPDNIFLRRRADDTVSVKLLDFGIAKLSGMTSPAEQLTKTGALIGTPHYMSPEQIDGANTVDARTDIYALGIILYEMFAGVLPFAGDTLGAVIKHHLLTPPPPMTVIEADVPPAIAVVINRMLVKNPDERYTSIDEVASDLGDVAYDKPPSHAGQLAARFPTQHGPAPAPTLAHAAVKIAPQPAPPPAPARRSLLPLILLVGTLFVAAAALGVYVLVLRDRDRAAASAGNPDRPGSTVDAGVAPVPAVKFDAAKLTASATSTLRDSLAETEPALRSAGATGLGVVGDVDSVKPIARLVSGDPDPTVRGHAANALARLEATDSAEVIAAQYKGASPALRVWFDEALVRLTDDKKARRRLTKAAGDRDLGVSFKAALALAELSPSGDKRAIKALSKLAAREAELRDVAPYAGLVILAKLARLRQATARDVLVATLKHSDEAARVAAAEGLARLGDETGRKTLLAILADKASPNRVVAARALVLLGDYSGFDRLLEGLADKSPTTRMLAARGVGEIGEQSGLPELAALLEDEQKPVRIAAAIGVLSILGLDPTVLSQASIDWAKNAIASQDWATRLAAARTIGDIDQDAAMPLFARAVVDDEPEVRRVAARSARRLRGPEPARALASAAAVETDATVQEEQVRSLAVMGEPVAKETLTKIAAGKNRTAVLASGALVALGDVDAVTQIDEAMRSRKSEIRIAAAESAALAGDPVVIPTLVVGLRDKLFKVRFFAAEALARYRAERDSAIAVLTIGLTDRDSSVQGRAFAALVRFGARPDKGPSPATLLASSDPRARLAALDAIAALDWDAAAPLLRRAVSDGNLDVRRAAVDRLAPYAEKNRDGVMRVYRSLARNSDPVTRVKAQSQLARLMRPAAATVAPTPTPTPAGDIEDLRTARDAVVAARGELEESQKALEKLVVAIDAATARPAKDENDVDRVEKLARDVERAAADVKKTRAALQQTVRRGQTASAGVDTDEAKAMREEIREAGRAGGKAVRGAIDAGRKARRKAKDYAVAETADPEIYLTSAKTAIATGKLRAARRDLRKAEKLFKARGKVDPDVYFAYGELYSKLAVSARGDKDKLRHLERAKSSFDRFASRGSGYRVGQARERSAEAATQIAALKGP